MKKLSLILSSLLFLFITSHISAETKLIQGQADVIDGDTIVINNLKIRLFGIDAPEKKQFCKKIYLSFLIFNFKKDYKCGEKSTNALKNDSLVQRVIEMAADVGQVNFTLQQEAIMGRPDFRPFAQYANMPVEILVGDEDQLTPTYLSEELDSLFCDSNLTILPDVGHLTSMEAPDQVTDVLTKLISSV